MLGIPSLGNPSLGIPSLGILVKHGRNTHYILCVIQLDGIPLLGIPSLGIALLGILSLGIRGVLSWIPNKKFRVGHSRRWAFPPLGIPDVGYSVREPNRIYIQQTHFAVYKPLAITINRYTVIIHYTFNFLTYYERNHFIFL